MSAIGQFADRYAVIPDLRGPRIRFGVLWGLVLGVAVVLGGWALAVFLAANAGVAGLQVTGRWHEVGQPANQPLAAAGAVVVVVAAAVNNTVLGIALLAFVAAALVFPVSFREAPMTDPRTSATYAWGTLAASLFPALAGAAAVQVGRVDAMALAFLVGAVCTYDAGNFLCHGGPRQRLVGPVAGMLGVLVVTAAMYFAKPPPFDGTEAILVGLLLTVLCPAGQLLGSWLLPRARTPAPALRRLDSWLLSAPAMLVAAWIAQR